MSQGGMHHFRWAMRTALRDARGSRARAVLYALSMALGIGALVAMGSLEADMARAVDAQTQNLVGADLVLWSRKPFDKETRDFIESTPAMTTHYKSFASMARFPNREDATHLARIRGLDGYFPFYGKLETEPESAADQYRKGKFALVARSLMERTGAQVGDPIVLGNLELEIVGILERAPGESLAATNLGPRIIIPHRYVEETGLIRQGSRVFYSQAFKFPPKVDIDRFMATHKPFFRAHRLTWDTVRDRKENLGEAMNHLGNYLNLTACLALLLGGLGVAGAVHYHIKRKTRQVATMRCLGATNGQVMAVYLIQVTLMTLGAIVFGTAMGLGFQFLLPLLVKGLIPIKFEPVFQPGAVMVAAGWGLLMSLLLAAMPLLRLRHISPITCFRPEHAPEVSRKERLLVPAIVGLCWWAFACIRTSSLTVGSLFALGLLVCLLLLLAAAKLLAAIARRVVSKKMPFALRHGLANLFRPHNQTSAFLVILGMGVFLITLLTGMRTMLVSSFQGVITTGRPNFIAFDIQPDQVEGVQQLMDELQLPVRDLVPIVPMRLTAVAGTPVTQLSAKLPDWAIQREYRSTYRESLTETEELVAGAWVKEASLDEEVIPISLEDDIAETLGVKLGDQLTVDVLGIEMTLHIASLRKVDWQSMQPNFFMVFPNGILEEAPQMYVLTTKTAGAVQVGNLQKSLVNKFPNISSMDLTEIVRTIDEIINKAASAVRFLAGLCIATGFLLLASAIWNSRTERLGEWALLRTLGAGRRQMAAITLVEYFLLGLFAALTGLLLALAANWALGHFMFRVPPFPEPMALTGALIALPLLTLFLGWAGLRGIWQQSPRYILKVEE